MQWRYGGGGSRRVFEEESWMEETSVLCLQQIEDQHPELQEASQKCRRVQASSLPVATLPTGMDQVVSGTEHGFSLL